MNDETLYRKADVDNAEMFGRVLQSLAAFTESQKMQIQRYEQFEDSQAESHRNIEQKLENIFRDMVTRQELELKLDKFTTKDMFNSTIEPQKKFMYGAIALSVGSFGSLVAFLIFVLKYATSLIK